MTGGKVLGLDWGTKRIGIAISDQAGKVALGRPSREREDLASDLDYLEELVETEEVQQVVIGMPLHMNGDVGQSAEKVKEFKQNLEKRLSITVDTVDERLTSAEAERVMVKSDLRREERKEKRDRVAATLILQRYLDSEVD